MSARISVKSREELEKEILTYQNVPVSLAAEYLGGSEMFIRCGLRHEKLPIGTAVYNKRYTYHISPHRLLAYQLGIPASLDELNLQAEPSLRNVAP